MAKTRRKQRSRVGRRSKRSRRSRVARRSKVGRRSRVGRRSKRTSRLNRSRRNIIKRRSTMKGGALNDGSNWMQQEKGGVVDLGTTGYYGSLTGMWIPPETASEYADRIAVGAAAKAKRLEGERRRQAERAKRAAGKADPSVGTGASPASTPPSSAESDG